MGPVGSAQMPCVYPPPNPTMGPTPAQTTQPIGHPAPSAQLAQHQLAYQHIHQQQQQQLHQQLQNFWANQYQEIEQTTDFKNYSLPLARIKKIMKADEDVRMISAEAPVIFALPREDLKDEVLVSTIPRSGPVGGPTEGLPYYYMPPPQVGGPGMYLGKPVDPQAHLYGPQANSYMAQPLWPQPQQEEPQGDA
ncbi:hypothetical protein R6Q57_006222 [Mikania cordata]